MSWSFLTARDGSVHQPRLLLREWAAVLTVVGLFVVLSAVAWKGRKFDQEIVKEISRKPPESIILTISGAVESPGDYRFSPGITLREVLKTAKLTSRSNRKILNLNQCFYNSASIEIPGKTLQRAKSSKQKIEKKKKCA